MPTPTFQPPQGQQDTAQLQDYIIKLIRDLNFMLGNLDTLNVNRLDAKVIIASTITALQIAANAITSDKIAASAITTDKLAAGAVTADKITVSQLSAIAADLGTIVAGIIYGAYIATANGTYPRIELSSTGNLLSAFKTAINKMYVDPTYTGPALILDDGTMQAQLFNFTAIGSAFIINSDHDINIRASTGSVGVASSAGTIVDIVAAILGKQNAFIGFTGTQSVITSVDFGASTTTSATLNFTNGVVTSIT